VRAWQSEEYRQSLPAEVRDELPPRPAGMDQLSDEQLEQAAGGITPVPAFLYAVGGAAGAAGSLTSAADAITDDAGVQGD